MPTKRTTQKRSSILDAVTSRTKVIALIVLIIEAIFLASLYALPEPQRISAFYPCLVVLAATIAGLFWLEHSEVTANAVAARTDSPSFAAGRSNNQFAPMSGIDVKATFLGFNYKDIILESKELVVILNDGRSWIDTNRETIRDRVASKGKITRFCLIHPSSPYIELLIRKNGKKKVTQLDEIRRSFELLTEISPRWAEVEIKAHMRPTPYCLFLTEQVAVVDPFYFFEAGTLPMIILANDTELYKSYRDDSRKLLQEAVPLESQSFVDHSNVAY